MLTDVALQAAVVHVGAVALHQEHGVALQALEE